MKKILITVVMIASTNLMANEKSVVDLKGVLPNYLQRVQVLDALNSINSGESVELPLTGHGWAYGDTFYKLNLAGHLICNSGITNASGEAKNSAMIEVKDTCKRITGIGEVTEVLNLNEDCWVEDSVLGRQSCQCSSSVETICKITKP